MRAVVQRVTYSSVEVNGEIVGEINNGFNVLLGISKDDTEEDMKYIKEKIINLRVFSDENDKMNLSAADIGGGLLVISQFTLYGDCRRGKRPSFIRAARPEKAIPLYEAFLSRCRETGIHVECGEFGADMAVELVNDGPVTIIMDTEEMKSSKK